MALGIKADEDQTSSSPTAKQSQMMIPTAPPLEQPSNDNNASYVNFVVVHNNTNGNPIAAKKSAIDASEGLRRIINENVNRDSYGNYLIRGVDENDFKQLIEYLEKKKLQFKDQTHRLQIFAVAKTYNCPELMIYCLREVDANLNVSNVIEVYRTLWFYGSLTSQKNPFDRKAKGKRIYTPEEYLAFLVFNVLQFINMNAENVLQSDEIGELTFKELENIVRQDDLLLRSEIVLINALIKWSREECRRKNIELTHENERRVLGELCYAPRYLTLKSSEFDLACKNIRYLDPAEVILIREAFDRNQNDITAEQKDMLNAFKKPRPRFARMPIHLSPRSHQRNYPRKMRQNDRVMNDEQSCILNCLACFLCLCD